MPADFNARISMLVKNSHGFLRKQEDARYELLKKISEVTKMCRQSVKASYAQDFSSSAKLLDSIQQDMERIVKKASQEGIYNTWPPVIQAYQEFLEAVFIYWIISRKEYKLKIKPPPASILYAVSDTIGELKRVILEHLRKGDLKEAEETYEKMEQLYENISKIALGESVLPGFKRKVDVNRASVESAYVILNEEQRRKAFLSSIEKYFERLH